MRKEEKAKEKKKKRKKEKKKKRKKEKKHARASTSPELQPVRTQWGMVLGQTWLSLRVTREGCHICAAARDGIARLGLFLYSLQHKVVEETVQII